MENDGTNVQLDKHKNFTNASKTPKKRKIIQTNETKNDGTNTQLDEHESESVQKLQLIVVNSNEDLILRLKIDKRGKTIIFEAAKSYKGFSGKITVSFPEYCVLGEEKIYLEIIPEDIINYYNGMYPKASKDEKILTPVLHIDRENGAPFLRRVTVLLPLVSGAAQIMAEGIQGRCPEKIQFMEELSMFKVTTTKFSEAAVKYVEVSKALDALALNDDFSQKYIDLGIYLMLERTSNKEFKIDIRKFRRWQEHQKFRMDETKFFAFLLNPQKVSKRDWDKQIDVFFEGPSRVSKTKRNPNPHVKEGLKKIEFWFPNPNDDVDNCNERVFEMDIPDEKHEFTLRMKFHSRNISGLASTNTFPIPYLSSEGYAKLVTNPTLPDHGMLVEFLTILGDKWVTFLTDYLDIEIEGMHDFILCDIRAAIGCRKLCLSELAIARLSDILRNRAYDHSNFEVTRDTLIPSIFRNFKEGLEQGRAKREIISMLEKSGVLSEEEVLSDTTDDDSVKLHLNSREVLASALMYIPMDKLKKAISNMWDSPYVEARSERVENFLRSVEGEELDV